MTPPSSPMPFYHPEPARQHDRPARTGILLINLGTPAAPTAAALRPYLKEFLWDRRVVEIPRPVWWLILNAFILPFRPAKSAEKYATIWEKDGSPLLVNTARMTKLLKGLLGERHAEPLLVDFAMRYGAPNVAEKLTTLREQGAERILLLPLYPQYAASSSGSALDAAWQHLLHSRNPPEIRTIKHFHDNPGYIDALRQSVEEHWAQRGRTDVLVMSFHGTPKRSLNLGDPYYCECRKTGRLLAEALALKPEQYRITFQSRFGRAEWLQPYTAATLEELGRAKTGRVDVICPGFVADCLETLEEIAMEGKASFLNSGGGEYRYIPALNDRTYWIDALADLAEAHMQSWLQTDWNETTESQDCVLQLERARKNGSW